MHLSDSMELAEKTTLKQVNKVLKVDSMFY